MLLLKCIVLLMITAIILPAFSVWSQRLLLRTWITTVTPLTQGTLWSATYILFPWRNFFLLLTCWCTCAATFSIIFSSLLLPFLLTYSFAARLTWFNSTQVLVSEQHQTSPVPINQQLDVRFQNAKMLQDVSMTESPEPVVCFYIHKNAWLKIFLFFFLERLGADCNLEGTLRAEFFSFCLFSLQSNCLPP